MGYIDTNAVRIYLRMAYNKTRNISGVNDLNRYETGCLILFISNGSRNFFPKDTR